MGMSRVDFKKMNLSLEKRQNKFAELLVVASLYPITEVHKEFTYVH